MLQQQSPVSLGRSPKMSASAASSENSSPLSVSTVPNTLRMPPASPSARLTSPSPASAHAGVFSASGSASWKLVGRWCRVSRHCLPSPFLPSIVSISQAPFRMPPGRVQKALCDLPGEWQEACLPPPSLRFLGLYDTLLPISMLESPA